MFLGLRSWFQRLLSQRGLALSRFQFFFCRVEMWHCCYGFDIFPACEGQGVVMVSTVFSACHGIAEVECCKDSGCHCMQRGSAGSFIHGFYIIDTSEVLGICPILLMNHFQLFYFQLFALFRSNKSYHV